MVLAKTEDILIEIPFVSFNNRCCSLMEKMVSLGIGESFGAIDVGLYGSLFTTANNEKTIALL